MHSKRIASMIKAVVVVLGLFGSASVFAGGSSNTGIGEPCSHLPLINAPDGASGVCVDVPVALGNVHVVFNNNQDALDASGKPIALQHMILLSKGLLKRIQSGQIPPQQVSIIGVFHGATTGPWLLNDQWWAEHVKGASGNPYKPLIEQIFTLKKLGVNVQLEECGVTMVGNGWTNTDLYSSSNGKIYVNQGAVGRLIDLQQKHYAYYQPGA